MIRIPSYTNSFRNESEGIFFLRDFDWRDLFWQPKKGPGQLLLHVVFLQSVNCISIYYKRAFYCQMSWSKKLFQKTVLKKLIFIFSAPSSPVQNRRLLSARNARMSSIEMPDDNEKSVSSASTSPCHSPVRKQQNSQFQN